MAMATSHTNIDDSRARGPTFLTVITFSINSITLSIWQILCMCRATVTENYLKPDYEASDCWALTGVVSIAPQLQHTQRLLSYCESGHL